jgi:hypothetical protein
MYSTTAYIYQQKTRVIMLDSSGQYFTLRYEPVYAKRLTINKGVDNVILFEFINQDEKPVNITGSTMIFRLVNQTGDALLAEKEMVILNAQYGRAKVTLTDAELDTVIAQPANYSITRASGNLYEAVFTDAAAGARAPVDIVDSIYPEFIPSSPLTIPTTDITAQGSYGGTSSQQYPDWSLPNGGAVYGNFAPYQPTEFYSSFIEPRGPITTVQMDLVGYTGTIKAQAAENYQSRWYNISESVQYFNETKTIYWNLVGWHPIMRLCFNNSIYTTYLNPGMSGSPATATPIVSNGVITGINITNAGLGYLAPPLVEFAGEGAGATAVATLGAQGSVASISIVTGGSGYLPVPPTMQAAQVIITTGRVENIFYR